MKTKGILFSTEMVQAILAGNKTMTRRIMKPQPDAQLFPCGTGKQYWAEKPDDLKAKYYKAKYAIDDILYVKETFIDLIDTSAGFYEYLYKADCLPDYAKQNRWQSSLFMPRKAARIFLKVTDVKAERLQDITEEDAVREGLITNCLPRLSDTGSNEVFYNGNDYPTYHFKLLWQSINGKNSWDENLWVWCYSFE